MRNVHLISLGCPKNLVDSENILGLLQQEGWNYRPQAEDSNVVVINTCGFLQSAVEESLDTVAEMVELKKAGKVQRVIVTGCLSQRYGGQLAKDMPEVDLFLGTGNFSKITSYLHQLNESPIDAFSDRARISDPDFLYDHTTPRMQATLRHTAYVKVSEGCNRTCSFCIIPKLRGRMRSRRIDSLVQEVEQLVATGVVEINLVAQDLTAYGCDLRPRQCLEDLLQQLVHIDGLQWLRLHYAYPHGFNDRLIRLLDSDSKLLPYIDMPLQHIDDTLLKLMRRNTRSHAIRRLIKRLRDEVRGLTLRTTLIVGFPGESGAAFARLSDFVESERFDRLGVFAYSREPDTSAATMAPQISERVKTRRRQKLMQLQQRISLENHRALLGSKQSALIEQQAPANQETTSEFVYCGRLTSQAPEIDGKTVVCSDSPLELGSIVPVRIDGVGPYDFLATTTGVG